MFTYSILSGIFIGTSFIPFPPWASLFAFVPLWHFWQSETSLKKIFWSGWITQFILTLIGFNWIIITIHDFGGLPWPVAFLGLLAFCSFATIYIPMAGLIYGLLKQKAHFNSMQSLLLIATLLALLEPLVKTIFPWNFGYTTITLPLPTFHIAEWIGFEGISSIIIFLNILSYFIIFPISKSFNRAFSSLCLIFILCILTATGYFLKISAHKTNMDKSLSVGIVQANIGNLQEQANLHGFRYKSIIINKYLNLSKEVQKSHDPDILIWPETAAPVKLGPYTSNPYSINLTKELKKLNISLITGTYTRADTGQTANSVVFIDKGEFISPNYSKTHLLAFGEYIPGSKLYPKVKTFLPQISDFKAGNGPQITNFKNTNFGVQICYESLFPRFSTKLAKLGAEVIVNVTNDSWYGIYMEPKQHLYMTLARAIETRRPLIRSTNTGISTVILSNGEILEQSPTRSIWTSVFDVPYSSAPKITFYTKYTNLGFYIKFLLLLLLLVYGFKQRKIHETKKLNK